jgi:DNA repair protein RecN (Recombination protein N)
MMLESIQIKNFAIIDSLNLEFSRGLTALTGETGAGKSILLDAIKLIAGDRADSDSVKAGQEKAEISVRFDLGDNLQARQWLQENELESDHECIVRRIVFANGRSKAFINGHNAPLAQLKGLSQLLVDLHGQHEHQSLQKPAIQQQLLDAYLADPALTGEVKQKYQDWRRLEHELTQLQAGSIEREQRIDLLNLYCRELAELSPVEGEIQTLQDEYSRLSHAGLLLENTGAVLALLYENDENTVQSQLSHCEQTLNNALSHDASLASSHELISNALIQVEEASKELRNYQDSIDLAPERLDWLNARIARSQELARKHHVEIETLSELRLNLELELETLLNSEQNAGTLELALKQKKADYLVAAGQLSARRRETALTLSAQITQVMQQLSMDGGQFEVQVDELDDETRYKTTGINTINYLVSANPGQPLKPLNKVASGGELSRISLAIQVILSESSRIPSLIFDEVDSGVGGGVAEIIGRKLRWLGENRQVFCVTHLPQVASQAHHHFRVEKTSRADDTSTDVIVLNREERLEEIARMLGGMTITEQTRAHANEMIAGQG